MKVIIRCAAIGILCTYTMPLLALTHNVQIKLKSLEVVQSQEKNGDELYISITEFPLNKRPQNFQIPEFPSHWLSDHLKNFREITLWKHEMNECQPTELLISLVEQDAQPWDIDDALGSIKLKLNCTQGKLTPEWVPLNAKAQPIPNSKHGFEFKADKGDYRVQFSIEDRPIPSIKK